MILDLSLYHLKVIKNWYLLKFNLTNSSIFVLNPQVCVGRALHNNQWVPGKVILREKTCHVSFDGQKFSYENFEVLLNSCDFLWVPFKDGEIPLNAIVGGKTSDEEILYVGEIIIEIMLQIFKFSYKGCAKHGESVIPGKIHPSHKCLYYLSDGIEHSVNDYYVLINTRKRKKIGKPFFCGYLLFCAILGCRYCCRCGC